VLAQLPSIANPQGQLRVQCWRLRDRYTDKDLSGRSERNSMLDMQFRMNQLGCVMGSVIGITIVESKTHLFALRPPLHRHSSGSFLV